MTCGVVKVDWDGKDATGGDYTVVATPEAVALGYMHNIPTLIQYPDGRVQTGNQVMVTPKGLEFLKREVPVDIRDPQGSA